MEKEVEEILSKYKEEKDLVSILREMQERYGYLSKELIMGIARDLNISPGEVYGVITFHPFLSLKPLGKNVIRVCKSLPCYLKNYLSIMKTIEKKLGIKAGQTSDDGNFSLHLTNCIGACDEAPAMMINDKIYGNLTPEKVLKILSEYE